jgi:hypothetical protein
MTRLRLAPALALAVVSFAASAAAAPVFIQGADSTTITSVLPPRGQGANCCGTCAGNDACPDCACWAVSMGMLLSYWDDTSYGGEGPWERLLPGGDAVDTEAFRATTQTLFDLFGGGSCEGSGTGLFFWFFCAEDRGLLETYNSSLGYSFRFFDHDWLDWNADVVVELNTWKPVYYGYYPEGGGSHVVLLVGYDEVDRTMWLYNTWDYAAHVKGFDEAWNHCAITTVPGGSDCTTGPCCSPLGAYRSHTYPCAVDAEREVGCPWGLACGQDLGVRTRDRLCTGVGTECNGEFGPWKEWTVLADCGDTESCDAAGERCAAGGACGCDCAAGDCCDGCRFLAEGTECGAAPAVETRCAGVACGSAVERREGPQRCTGMDAECTTEDVAWGAWGVQETCAPTAACVESAGSASCRDCPWGCDAAGCAPCPASCAGRECGDDGCGGSCGSCPLDDVCNPDGRCEYEAPPGLAGGSGCGCAVPGTSGLGGFLALLGALALAGARRRSRR